MRPSSSPSDGLFSALVAHGPVAAEVAAASRLRGAARMRANLDLPLPAAGPVSTALAESFGRARAHDVVAAAVAEARDAGVPLRDVLLSAEGVREVLSPDRLDALLAATPDTGDADRLVDAALGVLHGRRRSRP